MNFPIEQSALYGLPKDMLVKLILTIQNQYKPENIKQKKIVGETKKYMNETFKRKSIVIKEYLKRYAEIKNVLENVKTFKIFTNVIHVVLAISFNDGYFINCFYISNDFRISCADKNLTLIYKYSSGVPGVSVSSEEIIQGNEMTNCKKYIDFAKFLKQEGLIIKLFDYLNLHTKLKTFEK